MVLSEAKKPLPQALTNTVQPIIDENLGAKR
jgi:hypothetical protein